MGYFVPPQPRSSSSCSNLRELITRILPPWSESVPGYSLPGEVNVKVNVGVQVQVHVDVDEQNPSVRALVQLGVGMTRDL